MGTKSSKEPTTYSPEHQEQKAILTAAFEGTVDTPKLSIDLTYLAIIGKIEGGNKDPILDLERRKRNRQNRAAVRGDLDRTVLFYNNQPKKRPTLAQIQGKTLEFYEARVKEESSRNPR